MGTRSVPRAKSKARRLHRLQRQQRRAEKLQAGGENSSQSATLGPDSAHPAAVRSNSKAKGANCQPGPANCGSEHAGQDPLTIKQVAAAALILGQNVRKTAEALGVDRRTIQRWQKHDPDFQAALSRAKQEACLSSRQCLLALSESAVQLVEKELHEEQSPRAALAFLRSLGVMAHPKIVSAEEKADANKNEIGAQSATLDETATAAQPGAESDPIELKAEDFVEEVANWDDLAPAQQTALDALFIGKPLAEAATLAGATEEEVRSWLLDDWRFSTILTCLQFDRVCQLRFRLLQLTDLAVEIVQRAITAGDSRLAMALLRGLGLFS